MAKFEVPENDRTFAGWIEQLKLAGHVNTAKSYDTDIAKDFELLCALGLPRYDGHLLPCREFIDRFPDLEKHFIYPSYYLNLLPKEPGCRKYSLVGFRSLQEALTFVKTNVGQQLDSYMVRISEFEQNVYGGSLMCNDGIVVAEMAKGLQQQVSYGSARVISATLTDTQTSVLYSTEDIEERQLLWGAIQAIAVPDGFVEKKPGRQVKLTTIRGRPFFKGYFEFAYTSKPGRDLLRLVFFDVKTNPSYYNITAPYSTEP